MFDPALRPLKDAALAPLARLLDAVPPAALTGAGLAAGLGAAWAGFRGAWTLGFGLWVACRILDGLDGLVARRRGEASDLGGLLDLLADFVVYAAIPIGLALRPGAPPELPVTVAILLGVFYVNTASWMIPSALLERRGRGARVTGEPTAITIPEGLVSGTETIVFYALFFLLPEGQLLLVQAMAALTAVTVLQRLVWAVRVFGGQAEPADDPGPALRSTPRTTRDAP